ncbi:MAG: hypothetical protein KTR31_39365 [Myxococcales bacterium]|nr:hypothetical protein [Myxococcales bacterium]
MTGLWLVQVVWAAPPNELVALNPIDTDGGGQVERMSVSATGQVLVGRTQTSLSGWLYDLESWTLHSFPASPSCDVTGVVPIELYDGDVEVWASCGDGSVVGWLWDGSTLDALQDVDGNDVRVAVDDSLSDLWFYQTATTDWLYAVSVAGKNTPVLHVIDPFALTVDVAVTSGFPKSLAFPGYEEGVIVSNTLVIAHGAQDLSSLELTNPGSKPSSYRTGLVSCDDLAPSPALVPTVYCVDQTRDLVAEVRPINNTTTIVPFKGLSDPQAVGVSEDLKDGWLAVTGGQVTVWEMVNGVVVLPDPVFRGPDDADNPINDMVAYHGYLFGGGPQGRLHVVTARPWVEPADMRIELDGVPLEEGDVLSTGDEPEVVFTVDEDAAWRLHLGGDRTGSGTQLDAGNTTTDAVVRVPVPIGPTFVEGENRIYAVATNADELTGHGRVTLSVDNPPQPPTLTAENVVFGDEALTLEFLGIEDEDLDYYDVYVSDAPWAPEDFPEGGPAFDAAGFDVPIRVFATGGERQNVLIQPLENDVTYYIGVRATDTGGKTGPMSAVVEGTPRATFTASDLAGESGGAPCSTSPIGGGAFALLAGVLAFGRRRGGAVAAALVGVGLALVPASAMAQDDEGPPWLRRDLTPARGDFEIRYGVINLDDERITDVYDQSATNLLQAEFGPQFFRVAELDFGFGFFQELAYTVDSEGTPSSERTMLTWWPLSLDVTGRLHLLDEQPVVPFVRYGWDYVIWSEKSDNAVGSKDTVRGAKFGTHWGLGAQLLLDTLAPRRASLLEAQSGINDTWLTFEWRSQTVDGRRRPWQGAEDSGLNFSGNAFTVGLKLDY